MTTPPLSPGLKPGELRPWSAMLLSILLVASTTASAAALIVTLTRHKTTPAHIFTTAQIDAAQRSLCERFKLAGHASHASSSGPDMDAGLTYTAFTNGAMILETAIIDPALTPQFREGANAVALAYLYQSTLAFAPAEKYSTGMDDLYSKIDALDEMCTAYIARG
ncbi:hypothetical protein [Mycolicibacter minnesotensis]